MTTLPHSTDSMPPGSVTPADLAELMSTFNDVTSRLEATHARLRAEVERLNGELSQANRALERSRRLAALGEMAAGIAHEVRNPLGSIRLYARLLEEDLADAPEQCRTAIKIASAVRNLDAIVGDVLTFAKELRLSTHEVEVDSLFSAALETCQDCCDGIEIIRSDRADSPMDTICDSRLMQQALVNLIRNAIDAMDEDGSTPPRLTLDVHHDLTPDHDSVVLSVSDNGPGVDPDVVERMFNPFFTTRAAGTGLGLAIVHRIVDAHEGRVVVKSEPGRGATVELHLPRQGPQPSTTSRQDAA